MNELYKYSATGNFPNDIVNPIILENEIRDSNITKALDFITVSGDDVDIYFKDVLSSGDLSYLEETISYHEGTQTESFIEEVTINEEPDRRTGGHFCAESFELDLAAASGWYEKDISWPIPVSIYSASWIHTEAMEDDRAQFIVSPDTIIGTIEEPVASGDTRIYVTNTVIANTEIGYHLELYSASGVYDCNRVIGKGSDYVDIETPPDQDFSETWPTYVRQSVYMVPNMYLNGVGFVQIGQSKIGGSYIPANTQIKIRYQNNSGAAKKFTWVMEYTY